MRRVAEKMLFYLFVALFVYGVLSDVLWVRVVCIAAGILGAVLWIGWDWFVEVIRHGRTHRG